MSNKSSTEIDWKSDLASWLSNTASTLDDLVDYRWRRMRQKLGIQGIPQIQPYIGYADGEKLWLHGRVLSNPPAEMPEKDATWWDNVSGMMQRFASQEVPDTTIAVTLGDKSYRSITDQEGYYHFDLPFVPAANATGLWCTVTKQIVDSKLVRPEQSIVTSRFLAPTSAAQFGVISDVDDTVMYTNATHLLTMLKLTFLSNARTRTPLAGVATLYRALQNDTQKVPNNPIFYVSSSPWNLFDMLEDFFELNDIPMGPILLRDLGFDDNKFIASGHGHKLDKLRRILKAYPNLPFVLIGDSGQQDAKLYANAAEEFGERIQLALIRDVAPNVSDHLEEAVEESVVRSMAAGVPMKLIRDSAEAAQHCIDSGLMDPECYSSVRIATERSSVVD